jgi:hypothetical protein
LHAPSAGVERRAWCPGVRRGRAAARGLGQLRAKAGALNPARRAPAGSVNDEYKRQARAIAFNLKSNPELRGHVLGGAVAPGELARMSAADMADKVRGATGWRSRPRGGAGRGGAGRGGAGRLMLWTGGAIPPPPSARPGPCACACAHPWRRLRLVPTPDGAARNPPRRRRSWPTSARSARRSTTKRSSWTWRRQPRCRGGEGRAGRWGRRGARRRGGRARGGACATAQPCWAVESPL